MSRSLFFVAALLVALCFAFSSADTIVSDNFGSVVALPLTGGNATGGYTITGSLVRTSPYLLSVFINNIVNTGFSGATSESFWVVNSFSNGTLTNQTYQSSTVINNLPVFNGPVVSGNYLANSSHPNTNAGRYLYTFTIPIGQSLTINLTYNNTQNPPVVDLIYIRVDNPLNIPIIVGDPQFVGLRGQSFQVHGVDGAVYNIISEPNTQVNSRFVFLSEGKCPIFNGVPDDNCWSHPGSYLGELSFQQIVDGKVHAALVTAGDAKSGFSAIQMDGKALKQGEKVEYGSFSLEYVDSHHVIVHTEHFEFALSNSDMFVNQALRVKVPLSKLSSHGLLGQTHSTKVYPTTTRYIEGEVDDYVIADNDIFGNDFIYNQFKL